jgi:hypothetical protein
LINDSTYSVGSTDNNFTYDFVYHDKESLEYRSCNHGIRILKYDQIIKSAIVCASAGATEIHENSAIIDQDSILICCADKIFNLRLPDLTLNWSLKADLATCFGIYKIDIGYFVHGETQVTRIDKFGNIVWQIGLRDILVNIDNDQPCFVLHDNFIELQDFNSNKYTIDFNGKIIVETLSESQKRFNVVDKKSTQNKWWKIWN